MMTCLEIAIGLALIVGAFVWLVSAATAALVVMFSLSGMFYWVNIWFIPVAIALMAGAGRSFGLDYWIMPWLGNRLDRWIYGKPKHLYLRKIIKSAYSENKLSLALSWTKADNK